MNDLQPWQSKATDVFHFGEQYPKISLQAGDGPKS